jgi:hypothetical protein
MCGGVQRAAYLFQKDATPDIALGSLTDLTVFAQKNKH